MPPSVVSLIISLIAISLTVGAQPTRADQPVSTSQSFRSAVQPLLKTYCVRCHNADEMNSGIRVDQLNGELDDRHIRLWEGIRKQISKQMMPPEDERQPSQHERKTILDWIDRGLTHAKSRVRPKHGTVRRLTVSQYRNTLQDLLGIEDDLTDILPPDAVSKDGFLNNEQTMILSPLLLEAYFEIADELLDRCIVDPQAKPTIQSFRMMLGRGINSEPCPDKLILGANSHLLANDDFLVEQVSPQKRFEFQPFSMRTKFRFIEGYEGNATVRGWRDYDSIYHAVFACMRGNGGYPKGKSFQTVPEGLLLRPAIPSAELFQVESTYGPKANFKISLRELPDHGRFRIKVRAAKYDDALLLESQASIRESKQSIHLDTTDSSEQTLDVPQEGIYQVDVRFIPDKIPVNFQLQLGERFFTGQLKPEGKSGETASEAFMLIRLPSESLFVKSNAGQGAILQSLSFTRLDDQSEDAQRFSKFERRAPSLGVHLGLRRDCGSTLSQVEKQKSVSSTEFKDFLFEGAITNFPSPEVEKNNVNYLAGIKEIGVRSEYTDGRDMPRLLIQSIEFEGPYYESWPPVAHRNIFLDTPPETELEESARQIIRSFATRAFRRPVTDSEESLFLAVWRRTFDETQDFQQSVKDALIIVLTSPQFLFLIEDSQTPAPEPLDSWELASKLSYFLWNSAPDERLLNLAKTNKLHDSLDSEVDRMVADPRFSQFTSEFATQWLSLDKFDVVEIDRDRYPTLTRDTRTQLREESAQLLRYLIQHNLPVENLIQSDLIIANEVVASYYDLGDCTESGFEFVPISHSTQNLGGLLSQASILAGLSDGREANPVKRGAWLARKIIAEPPDDPPPNVPELEEDTSHLTLRERLEKHRNQTGCAKCHAGIDPWGLPFEQFDAGGLFKQNVQADSRSTLPDETEVENFQELRSYLVNDRIDRVAFSVLKHLATYAVGRSLSYTEIEFLKGQSLELKPRKYPMRDLIHFVVKSQLFLEK